MLYINPVGIVLPCLFSCNMKCCSVGNQFLIQFACLKAGFIVNIHSAFCTLHDHIIISGIVRLLSASVVSPYIYAEQKGKQKS